MSARLARLYATYRHATPEYHARRIEALQAEIERVQQQVRKSRRKAA